MDLEDRRIRGRDAVPPRKKCHDRNNNRDGGGTRQWKIKGKIKCPDKETKKIQKPAQQINPLMTVLMSSRAPQQHDGPTGGGGGGGGDGTTSCVAERRLPLDAYKTVVIELPERLQYKPAAKKSTPTCKLTSSRKCLVPDPNKLKISLRW